jgi:hypothetical protein
MSLNMTWECPGHTEQTNVRLSEGVVKLLTSFVLAVIPLAAVIIGVSSQTPVTLGQAKLGGVPLLVVALLLLLVWLVLLAWWYLGTGQSNGDID